MQTSYNSAVGAQFRGTEEQCNTLREENTLIIWTVLFIQSRVLIQFLLITDQFSIPAEMLFCIPRVTTKNPAIFYIHWGQENLLHVIPLQYPIFSSTSHH